MEGEGATGAQATFSEAQMKAIAGVVGSLLEKALNEKKDGHSEGAISNRPSGSQAASAQGESCRGGTKGTQGCVLGGRAVHSRAAWQSESEERGRPG